MQLLKNTPNIPPSTGEEKLSFGDKFSGWLKDKGLKPKVEGSFNPEYTFEYLTPDKQAEILDAGGRIRNISGGALNGGKTVVRNNGNRTVYKANFAPGASQSNFKPGEYHGTSFKHSNRLFGLGKDNGPGRVQES